MSKAEKLKRDLYRMVRQPLTPEALAEYGAFRKLSPPKEPSDRAKPWRRSYRLFVASRPWYSYRGFVKIERGAEEAAGGFGLRVEQHIVQDHQAAVYQTEAVMQCGAGPLAAPRSWEVRCKLVRLGKAADEIAAEWSETGSVAGQKITRRRGKAEFRHQALGPYTCDWSLFEASERLAGPQTKRLEFDLLEELVKWKSGHSLQYREQTTLPYGSEPVPVHCYEQVGRGALPRLYYVDAQHRLLLVLSGPRAYILDPGVDAFHSRSLKWLRRRGPR